MSIGFRPLGLNFSAILGTGEQAFLVKILDAAGSLATVSVNGVIINVKAEIPLKREQLFLVKQEQRKDGSTAWRILRELVGEQAYLKTGKPANMLSDVLENALPKQEVGTQLQSGQPFPFFCYLPVNTEAYLLSKASGDGDDEYIRLMLQVETEVLGKMRIDLTWGQGVLGVGTYVENEQTKELIDKHWPELAAKLETGGLRVKWSGCVVDKSSFEQILTENVPRSVDILV